MAALRGTPGPRLVGERRALGVSTNGTPKRAARFLRFSSSSSITSTLSGEGFVTGRTAGAGAGVGFFGDGAWGKLSLCRENEQTLCSQI